MCYGCVRHQAFRAIWALDPSSIVWPTVPDTPIKNWA